MRSAWPAWLSQMLFWESCIPWPIKQGLLFPPATFPMDVPTLFICPMLFAIMPKIPRRRTLRGIARRMGLAGTSQQSLFNSLCEKYLPSTRLSRFPQPFRNLAFRNPNLRKKLSSIAELAVGDACTGSNPRAVTPAEMERLLTCTYYGTE